MRIVLLLFLAQSIPAFSDANVDAASELDAALAIAVKDSGAGALLDVRGCGLSYLKARGVANRKTLEPMPTNERLRLASIGKLYTATVVHRLVELGLLDLGETVERYIDKSLISGVPNTNATINQLLNHTSGIPDYYDFRSYLFWDWKKPLTWDRIVHVAQRHEPGFQPGQRYGYSNTNYHLLALAAEHVSGLSFDQLVESRVLEPLGLAETRYNTDHPGGTIHGYGTILRPWADTWVYAENTGADSGITATPSDLRRFLQSTFFEGGVNATIGEQMLANEVSTERSNQFSTAGAEIFRSRDGLELIGHTGDTFGYLSFAFAIPDHRVTLIGHINAAKPKALSELLKNTVRAVRVACGHGQSQ